MSDGDSSRIIKDAQLSSNRGFSCLSIPTATSVLNLTPNTGALAFNTSTDLVEVYDGTAWIDVGGGGGSGVSSFSGGTTGFDPNFPTTGPITLTGILNISNGGTGNSTLTTTDGVIYSNGTMLTSTVAGTTGQILIGNTGGPPSWSNLSNFGVTSFSAGTTGFFPAVPTAGVVTLSGVLNVSNGGTGSSTVPSNGQIPIGNGTGFTIGPITTGTGISTTTGAGTLQINNTGVTSNIGGTGISVSGATGAVTITNTGLLSIKANGGTAETGVINLVAGTNMTIVDSPAGTFTFTSTGSGGVASFQTSLSGLTPNTATTGAVTLAGVLGITSGGTGSSTGPISVSTTIPALNYPNNYYASIAGVSIGGLYRSNFNSSITPVTSGVSIVFGTPATTVTITVTGTPLVVGTLLTGSTNIQQGTYITSQVSGTTGGSGVYNVTTPIVANTAAATVTGAGYILSANPDILYVRTV